MGNRLSAGIPEPPITIQETAAGLKDALHRYGVSCFVAHVDIEPTKEWLDEIEKALSRMDVMVALTTDNFHENNWTDQEVGLPSDGECL